MKTTKLITLVSVAAISLLLGVPSNADPVRLQGATATFSQTVLAAFSIDKAIDGVVGDLGWAIYPNVQAQTAVFETGSDTGFLGGSVLTFKLSQTGKFPSENLAGHNLGRFRLSVTTDDRSTFADGLSTGGDVTANWTVLDPISFSAANGTILTKLDDGSILASGPNPDTEVYTVAARTTLTRITGIRLEAIPHPSLSHGGPGRSSFAGNFVLTEFGVSISLDTIPLTASIHRAVQVCWSSLANKTYQVQWRSLDDLTVWRDLGDPIRGTGAEICVFDSTRAQPRKFYRILQSD